MIGVREKVTCLGCRCEIDGSSYDQHIACPMAEQYKAIRGLTEAASFFGAHVAETHYALDSANNVVACPDHAYWAIWFNNYERSRVRTDFTGMYWVSTVFRGLGRALVMPRPIAAVIPPPDDLFETMVFLKHYRSARDSPGVLFEERCATWAEALQQHEAVLERFATAVAG